MKYAIIFLFSAFAFEHAKPLPDFMVYGVNGTVTILRDGGKGITVKQKDPVYKGDVVVLEKSARLILVDTEYNFLELKDAGRYEVSELIGKTEKQNHSSSTKKYFNLLYHELFDPNHDFEKFKKKNISQVYGGVTRGDNCANRLFPAEGLITSANAIEFRWRKTSPSSTYTFYLYDADGKELSKKELKDTVISLVTKEIPGSNSGKYYWTVSSKDGRCEDEAPIDFEVITAEQERKMIEEMGEPDKELPAQLDFIDRLNRSGLFYAAKARYAGLVGSHPNDQTLRKSYSMFLLENSSTE